MEEELLAQAQQAQERLLDAERDAEVARADFHRAVRRLHLSGASLRELAGVLGLSHQRVHQIVEGAGGARPWTHRSQHPAANLACSFCGRAQRQVRVLVAGAGAQICESCVKLTEAVLASGRAAKTALGPVQAVPGDATRRRCSFCGKHRYQVTGLATTVDNPSGRVAGDATICTECLALCAEIIGERLA